MTARNDIHEIEEYFVTELLKSSSVRIEHAIFDSVSHYPMSFASEAVFAFVSAAAAFENPILEVPDHLIHASSKIYAAVALLSADIYAAETLFQRRVSCHDIVEIWLRTNDRYFTAEKLSST